MDALFKKLNYKGQSKVYCLNAPASFDVHLASVADTAEVARALPQVPDVAFALVFVTKQSEIDALVPQLAPNLQGDALLWMCYPKGTSKNYRCDFNRDTGWHALGTYDLEPVRMVAIDEDWSALRFRKVDYIKTLTRQFGTLSDKGKAKAGQ